MKRMRPVSKTLGVTILAAIVAAGLSGCRSFSLPSGPYSPEGGIALQPDGPLQGVVDTGDLTLAYAYAVTFEPARQLRLSGGVRSVRFKADSVNVYLHLLDSTGRVMEKSVLYASGFKPSTYLRRPRTFDTRVALPPGAASMAFSSYVKRSAGRR